jgi:MurNAc alpha-1-phosphate uridylyltransferase
MHHSLKINAIAILAGGLATRLGDITKKTPKSLVCINKIPFIDYQLRILEKQGIKFVVLCVGHMGHLIEEHVGDGGRFGLKIYYSYDGDKLLGTGGALVNALDKLPEFFFVLYGDSFLPISFFDVVTAFFLKNKPALMTLLRNENKWDVSNVNFDGSNLYEYNKNRRSEDMKYIDYGLSILSKNLFKEHINNQGFDLADLFFKLSHKKQLAGFEVYDRFYEIGSLQGIKDLENFFLQRGIL